MDAASNRFYREAPAAVDFAGDAYRACMHGNATAQQQRSAAAQIVVLHGLKGELLAAAQNLLKAWNALLPENKLFKAGAADDLENLEFREMQALRAAIAKASGSAS